MSKSATERAEEIGREHGHGAGTWVIDGNTSAETCRWYLKGIKEGDPLVLDSLNAPDLPHEHYEKYDERDLADDIDLDFDHPDQSLEDAAEAYRLAAGTAFWDEVERSARAGLG